MKLQSLKTVLHAFIFTLAIVASFAFKPSPNDVLADVYIQRLPPEYCDLMTVGPPPYGCSIYNWGANCTMMFNWVDYDIFSRGSGLLCVEVYRKPY